ncbi:MAG: FAD-dependent oxidoreductase [Desulfobacteraceae bacterium]|nr:FAD-dependent oxidoreductase [Desulfobacteraceae bacterium]
MLNPPIYDNCDVAIIGAGPAGLAAAIRLKKLGIENVLVLDRESEPGGIPRHCGHPPFGMLEFARVMRGPSYARRLVGEARRAGVGISVRTSVTMLGAGGGLTIASPQGNGELTAKRVLLSTGVRETPQSARLMSGARMLGICTTGALQAMVYLKGLIPFRRPVIVGTETVAFSALLTCKKAGIKPVAMIEGKSCPGTRWPFHNASRLLGVPLFVETRITKIIGGNRIEAIKIIDGKGNARELACDGLLFTGQFTPESSLVRMSHLLFDHETGSPVIDPFGRCSDSAYFAAGNLLQPLKMAMNCWREGRKTAQWIAKDIAGSLPDRQ